MDERGTAATVAGASLAGWRGRLVKTLAAPIARRTRFDEGQIVTFVGVLLLAYPIVRKVGPLVAAARRS